MPVSVSICVQKVNVQILRFPIGTERLRGAVRSAAELEIELSGAAQKSPQHKQTHMLWTPSANSTVTLK